MASWDKALNNLIVQLEKRDLNLLNISFWNMESNLFITLSSQIMMPTKSYIVFFWQSLAKAGGRWSNHLQSFKTIEHWHDILNGWIGKWPSNIMKMRNPQNFNTKPPSFLYLTHSSISFFNSIGAKHKGVRCVGLVSRENFEHNNWSKS